MRVRKTLIAAASGLMLGIGAVIAPLSAQDADPPPSKTLTPGKGVELTIARCVICHDATHITRAKLSRGEWEFNIKNMIERGAPIASDEIPVILDYLVSNYSRDSATPEPLASAAPSGEADGGISRMLTTNACVACHQTDKRVVGPSFREVAARFANDGDAAAKLAKKIREGGAGNWGNVPMPPQPGLSDSDLNQLVNWILSQK